MSGTEAETIHEAGAAVAEFDAGESIMHHILDSHEIEIPFTTKVIELPTFEVFGFDLSITKHVVMLWLAAAILLVVFGLAARRRREPVPTGLRNMLEVVILFIRDEVARKSIPVGADRFVGYLLSTFFFILVANLMGMIPGLATATGNVSVTAGLALLAFFVIQASGIREYGVVKHFANLVPRHGVDQVHQGVYVVQRGGAHGQVFTNVDSSHDAVCPVRYWRG